MVLFTRSFIAAATLLAVAAFAHLDHDATTEMAQHAEYMASIDKRSLSRYATKL